MHASVYLPLVIAGLFGLTAPRLALRLPPAAATWLLSVGGLIAAAGAAASLTLLGFTLVGRRNRSPSRGTPSVIARGVASAWPACAVRVRPDRARPGTGGPASRPIRAAPGSAGGRESPPTPGPETE